MKKTTIRNGALFCLNCGGDFKLIYPLAIEEMTKKIESFDVLHNDCEATWVEPKPDQSKDIKVKAMFWLTNGEKGMSSETMWHCLYGNKDFRINHPYDPDDFSRCYKLLVFVPEWKSELYKLKLLSRQWSNLVDNWGKLTEMYEQNTKDGWKNSKQIGMYEFMQTLINV